MHIFIEITRKAFWGRRAFHIVGKMRAIGGIMIGQRQRPGAAFGDRNRFHIKARQRARGENRVGEQIAVMDFSTVTIVFVDACDSVARSRVRPIQTLPSRSAIGAWNSATSGLMRGKEHDRIVVAVRVVDRLPFAPVRHKVRADQSAQRHEGNALHRCFHRGVDRGAGGVLHLQWAREHRSGETRRRAEFAHADGGSFQRLDASGPIRRSACSDRVGRATRCSRFMPRRIRARVASMATPETSRGTASMQPSVMAKGLRQAGGSPPCVLLSRGTHHGACTPEKRRRSAFRASLPTGRPVATALQRVRAVLQTSTGPEEQTQ